MGNRASAAAGSDSINTVLLLLDTRSNKDVAINPSSKKKVQNKMILLENPAKSQRKRDGEVVKFGGAFLRTIICLVHSATNHLAHRDID